MKLLKLQSVTEQVAAHLREEILRGGLVGDMPGAKSLAANLGIYPTLCELAGVPLPEHLDGKSLVKIVNDPNAKSDGIAISFREGSQSTITQDTHTILKNGEPFLKFDLTKDPHEEHHLAK